MNDAEKAALETLQSPYFFSKLRSVLSKIGLEGEQKAAIALFFVMASRFFSNPLRLFIRQKTEGSAKYIFQRVAQLLPSEISASIARRERWLAFKKSSMQRVVYIPPWDEVEATEEKADFEICENQLTRVLPLQEEGRITEKKEAVETSFVCISAREMPELNQRSRWLTMKLAAPAPRNNKNNPLSESDVAKWHEIQRMLERRAETPVRLPEWYELVIEKMCQNQWSCTHIPALLQSWKTMALLRSFGNFGERPKLRGAIEADFKDLAATAALLRGVCSEGAGLPSMRYIHNKIFPAGRETILISPLTDKPIKYMNQSETPQYWPSMIDWVYSHGKEVKG